MDSINDYATGYIIARIMLRTSKTAARRAGCLNAMSEYRRVIMAVKPSLLKTLTKGL